MINQDTSLPITINHLFIVNWGGIDTPNSTRVSIMFFFGEGVSEIIASFALIWPIVI
jgi:hypothetical protein